jgi:uncharacterized MAPEG superfamily protein
VYTRKTSCKFRFYHTEFRRIRQEKTRQHELPRKIRQLLLAEGHAVGALIHGRICLMGADQNSVEGAVVFAVAVVCALLDGAFNGLVCMTIHNEILL